MLFVVKATLSDLRQLIMNNQILAGRAKQVAGSLLIRSGHWIGSYRLMRAGRRLRSAGSIQITVADARAVIRRCMRRDVLSM